MKKIKDLAVKTGSYTTKDGETKNKYENIGAIVEGQDGSKFMFLKRSFNPAGVPFKDGSTDIIVSLFDVKKDGEAPQQAQQPQQPQQAQQAPEQNGEIPF